MVGFLIAVISGALMSVQGVFNTGVTKSSSIWVASAFVQLSALIVCFCAWLFTDRTSFVTLTRVEPKYMIRSMEMLGPARAVMLIVTAQLLAAYMIELFGIFGVEKQPFSFRRMIGMAAAIVGIVVFKWE